jgi:hypothetical protein
MTSSRDDTGSSIRALDFGDVLSSMNEGIGGTGGGGDAMVGLGGGDL